MPWLRLVRATRWGWRARPGRRPGALGFALGLGLALALAVSASTGAVKIPLSGLVDALVDEANPWHAPLVRVRLPRLVGALCVGGALAVAGALMQTAVRNPLADGGLLGVSAGAGLAVVALLTLRPEAAAWLPAAAFAGALSAMATLLGLAVLAGARAGPLALVLAGVALQSMLFAGIALLTFLFADRAPAFVQFTVGSLASTSWREVAAALPVFALGLGAALWLARSFDLLWLDDSSAKSLGLSVVRTRLLASALAAILVGAAVSLAGLVGFVGLLVPNWLRLAAGASHRRLLPLAALAGALLTLVADLLARTVAAPLELPVGALLAAIGGPYFLVLLFRRVAT